MISFLFMFTEDVLHIGNIFWNGIGPILPLYFWPRANWPLIHFPATLLSPHSCTSGPSSRRWTGPQFSRCCGFSFCFSFSSQFLCCVSSNGSHSARHRLQIFSCLQLSDILPFYKSSLHRWPIQLPIYPRRILDLATSNLCFHLVWLHGSFPISNAIVDCHHFVLLHFNTCLKVLIIAWGLSSQTRPIALHILSAITSDNKRKSILPIFSWQSCKFLCNS